MKRRDFLSASVLAGAGLPIVGLAQTRPCPPSTVAVDGGQTVTTACVAGDAQGDWVARSTGPGVIWAHRFNDPATVARFTIAPDLPQAIQYVKHVANDGIMGDGCLSIDSPAGARQYGSWGRPMRPIAGDVNKPGLELGPTITSAAQANSAFVNMRGGFFGHSEYHTRWPGQFIGTDYYLQFRVKFHPNRFNADEPMGKMLMFVTGYQTPQQEIVMRLRTDYGGRWFNMYTSVGTNFNSELNDPQGGGNGSSLQPGGAFGSTCIQGVAPDGTNKCYLWPTGEWITVLVHVIPGRQHVSSNLSDPANPKETGIEVFVARAGQTTYTKIWDKKNYVWFYDANYVDQSPAPFGWNWLNFTAFTGGSVAVPSAHGYYHRHDQMIFSKQFIPCPVV